MKRAQSIFYYALTALLMLGIGCAISVAFQEPTAPVRLAHRLNAFLHGSKDIIQDANKATRLSGEIARFSFDLKLDLSRIWNWNFKIIFVWLKAEYSTTVNGKVMHHQAVLWDAIIRSREDANLTLTNVAAEYPLFDTKNSLRSADVNLTVSFEVIPNIGLLKAFTIPTVYPVTLPATYQNYQGHYGRDRD